MAVDPLERLTNLVALLLSTPRPLTLEEITYELRGQYPPDPVARRGAFERDKRLLREEGIPIELVPGERGGSRYRIDRTRYELPDLGLTDDERAALALAVATVQLGESWGAHAMAKVSDDEIGPGETAVAVIGAPDVLPALFGAQTERRSVEFNYRGITRRLDPYGLLARGGFWYVVGREHASGEPRTFRVDRIEGTVAVLDPAGSYAPPAGFDPATALQADPKLMGEGPEVIALVLVDAIRAHSAMNELDEGAVVESRRDGSVVFRVGVRNRGAFRSWLLGFLDHAEVLEPAGLRAEMVSWLQEIAK